MSEQGAAGAARGFVAAGAIAGALGVAAGAFGAHALRAHLAPELLAVFEVGVRYQMYHALALVAAAWVASTLGTRAARAAGWLFVLGIVLFSGSLYALVLSGQKWLGAITPVGGTALVAGWCCLAWAAWRGR